MAYAAVISLKQTINELLLNSPSPASSSTRETLEFAYDQSTSLQKVLERFDDSSGRCSERLNDLEGQIRDVANQVEDALEFHGLDESCSWEEVEQEISSLAEAVKKMEVDYIEEISKPVVGCIVSSYTDFGVEMVGNSAELNSIQFKLRIKMRPDDMALVSFLGEVGTGRTSAARIFYDDQCNREERLFECCAWVRVGNRYQIIGRVMINILVQILGNPPILNYEMLSYWDLCRLLNSTLKSRRYLLVLDDVHDDEIIHYLEIFCPDEGNGSLAIYTTSSYELCKMADMAHALTEPSFVLRENTWFMLREGIFFGESMTPQHVEMLEYGKQIIEMCPPAPIPMAKALLLLYKTKNSPDKWKKIAAAKKNHIFMVKDEISEVDILRREIQSFDTDDRRAKAFADFLSEYVESITFIKLFKMKIQPERFFDKMQILSLWGMAGIGKSFLAKKIFKDESFICRFDHCVWVTLGLNYQPEEILIDILAQMYPRTDKMLIKEDEELVSNLCAQLAGKRCFIVLDDLWSKDPLIRLKESFPGIMGTALVTTRLAKVAKFGRDDTFYEMKLLNKEESWCLLREKVFAQGLCSSELEKAGRKIAEKCEGLPLLILTVANHLLKVEVSEEYWNSVAIGKEKSVFMNAHHEINKILLPSYERLPQHIKACFLYICAFHNDYKIPTSKLTYLWILERFLEPNSSNANIVAGLVGDSLVLGQRRVSDLEIKTCRFHPIYWQLSNSVVVKNKLFYGMNSYEDFSIESMTSQRRLCIRNNVLLGIKDVCNAMKSSSKSRSLLCTGPPHQYPVSLYFGSRLLRVLDAVSIRWYEFPDEVVELIHLRYLSLTCNGRLPTSISKLLKLQHLIVNRYINTKSSENCSPLPVEIWDMKELIHLQVMGGILPNPKCCDGLPNLSTLLDVSAQSCAKEVLKGIPNLKRLSIKIELAPDEKGNPFHFLNNISQLQRLESLKCAVTNPHIRSDIVPPEPISMFPSSLKELSLSGFGYPWEYMSTIGKLKNLQVLKLKQYAFRGPKWENMGYNRAYSEVKFLLVEDTDLVHWDPNATDFLKLERLSIKHCYKLQKPPFFTNRARFKMLEIVDCSPLTVRWAENVIAMVEDTTEMKVRLSWIDEK